MSHESCHTCGVDVTNDGICINCLSCAEKLDRTRAALAEVLRLIDSAGLQQLTRGVELGATSWFVKMSDAINFANEALGKAKT